MKVIVGMSGGVDSSVTALLLKNAGYEVQGLFMKNWEEDDSENFCNAEQDILDAESVCNKLNIPLHTVNFSAEYWELVFEYFLSEYKNGRTPNPDILCNQEIKFKVFLDYALSLGADYIATGHYARKSSQDSSFGSEYQLKKGLDPNKDQSYFLYTATQRSLAKTLFPIGEMHKAEVRALARNAAFPNHQKKDSTGICFIGERKFRDFLKKFTGSQPGNMITTEGKVIGQHAGLMFYTLGQRQGLGIGGQANSNNEPWYVVDKDMTDNALIVANGENHPLLYKDSLKTQLIHWIHKSPKDWPFSCTAKIRYRQKDSPCTIIKDSDERYTVKFKKPERAITPGQSIVFYQDDLCLGGGIIL